MADPFVRFDGFTQPWKHNKLGELTIPAGIKNKDNLPLKPYSITNQYGFIPQDEAHDEFGYMQNTDRSAYIVVSPYSFGYNPARINVGSLGYYAGDENVIVSSLYEIFQTKEELEDAFLWQWFQTETFQKWIKKLQEGSVRQYFYYEKLREVYLNYPEVAEQQRIADFLSSVDDIISTSQQEVANLELQKKAVMRSLFSRDVRFKNAEGVAFPEWEEHPLNYYLNENKDRNKDRRFKKEDVLSVSKDYGVVNQIAYFGKSLAGEDLSNYHCVSAGDIVYTKSPLGKQPYGIIKASGTDGIVSTLYAVYHCNEHVLPEFVDYYFSRDVVLNNYLKPLVNIGAKHDMKVHNDVAISGLVYFPSSVEEQRLIVDFLSAFDEAIEASKKELELWKRLKNGLLQQMFV